MGAEQVRTSHAGEEPMPTERIEMETRLGAFLAEMSDLSSAHGFGLTEGATLYVLEADDLNRVYFVTDDSKLGFS